MGKEQDFGEEFTRRTQYLNSQREAGEGFSIGPLDSIHGPSERHFGGLISLMAYETGYFDAIKSFRLGAYKFRTALPPEMTARPVTQDQTFAVRKLLGDIRIEMQSEEKVFPFEIVEKKIEQEWGADCLNWISEESEQVGLDDGLVFNTNLEYQNAGSAFRAGACLAALTYCMREESARLERALWKD